MTAVVLTEDARARLRDLVRERSGLTLRHARADDLDRALGRRAPDETSTVGEALVERLHGDSALLDELVDDLVIGETYFFRDASQLDELAARVFPETVSRLGPTGPIRIWSAGCASGEEPYTLAMLLDELGLGARARVLGTDISRRALAKATRASYSAWSLRGMNEERVLRHLDVTEGGFAPKGALKARVTLSRHNLMDRMPPFLDGSAVYDVVVCRNTLLYFTVETARAVGLRLLESVAPDGFLLLGPSDPMLPQGAAHDILTTNAGVMYRKRAPQAAIGTSFPPLRLVDPPSRVESPDAEAKTPRMDDRGARASAAFDAGDWHTARRLAKDLGDDPRACAVHVRAEANLKGAEATLALAEACCARHPASPELHAARASLLLDAGHEEAAFRAARKVLYLDRDEPLGHALVGAILMRRGDHERAEQAFARARALAEGRKS